MSSIAFILYMCCFYNETGKIYLGIDVISWTIDVFWAYLCKMRESKFRQRVAITILDYCKVSKWAWNEKKLDVMSGLNNGAKAKNDLLEHWHVQELCATFLFDIIKYDVIDNNMCRHLMVW